MGELCDVVEGLVVDFEVFDWVEVCLSVLSKLKNKYGFMLEDVVEFGV